MRQAQDGPGTARWPGGRRLRVLQLDPPLFTAPYDAALAEGLAANGIDSSWPSRPLRPLEEDLLGGRRREVFYRWTEGQRRRGGRLERTLKGAEHAVGLARVSRLAARERPDLIHVQWAPVPALDRWALDRMRRDRPVVLTVHDIVPFNGRPVSRLQRHGYDGLLACADRLIVHTEAGRAALLDRGIPARAVSVVPHGLLPLAQVAPEPRAGGRWRVVLFGHLKAYKGADVLIEALGRLGPEVRERLEVVVAGEAQMPTSPLVERAARLGLGASFVLREGRLSDPAMAALLRSADAFVFPYRSIDASGVLHLVAPLGRWLIASDLAGFRLMLTGRPGAGALVPPGDVEALAGALRGAVGRVPSEPPGMHAGDWTEIGRLTRAVYERALGDRRAKAA